MPDGAPQTWTVIARNLPEHANNPIHTDDGAIAQGFPSALVAGVTTYAYLTHPLVAAWGVEWVERGGGEVRFRAPVFASRQIDCAVVTGENGRATIEAVDASESVNPRAVLTAALHGEGPRAARDGERLAPRRYVLDGAYGCDYGARAGDDLALYDREAIIHPAVWPALANNIIQTELANGAWIHIRSLVNHHSIARSGDTVDVEATVVDRFVRHGARAVLDVLIECDGRPVATIEHEAIVDLSVT
jgi:acyl dehydratase